MRDRFNSDMTMPAVRRETKERRDAQNTIQKWALDPAWQNAVYGAMLWLGIGSAFGGWLIIKDGYLFGLLFIVFGSPMFGYGAWGSWTLSKRLQTYAPTALLDEYEEINQVIEPKTPHETMVKWRLLTSEYVEFKQPEPGEFVRLAALALDDNSGVTFSQNKAKSRGWPTEMHGAMMAVLSDRGIIYQGKNQAPVITGKGRNELTAYIRMTAPSPTGNNNGTGVLD